MEKYTIIQGKETELDLIRPLWEKLNQLHADLSPYFKDRYLEMEWDKRKCKLLEKSKHIQFEYVIELENDQLIGYCISSIDKDDDTIGEIDSIYIDETHRKSGLGKQLFERAIQWLVTNGTETQKLIVGVGNEQVLDFYKHFDFYPLHIVLQRNTKK
jgi:ribosomal protein S18 acetylase RimI-like enzyme